MVGTAARIAKDLAGGAERAPRPSAARTAGSAGLRRRNAQLGWAARRQDPHPASGRDESRPYEKTERPADPKINRPLI